MKYLTCLVPLLTMSYTFKEEKRFIKLKNIFIILLLFFLSMSGCGGWMEDEQGYRVDINFKFDGARHQYYYGEGRNYNGLEVFYWADTGNSPWEDWRVKMSLPTVGVDTYTYGTDVIDFIFTDDNGIKWSAQAGFNITVTSWTCKCYTSNDPYIAKGTFSGTVTNGSVTKLISEGSFEGKYSYYVTWQAPY
jgi:hypothetical protein